MARLTIEQVKAPDFSASSEMLARANQSFNAGMESAKGILSSYQEGQQQKADDEVFGLLARADSPEALQEILNSDLLLNRSNSESMRNWIGGLRTELLGNEAQRASIDSTRAATDRANAAEGRLASEYGYMVDQRGQLARMTPYAIAAEAEGRRYGASGPTSGSTGLSADNPVFSEFMGTIRDAGVTNPYALAAIAATGSHESGFSAANAARTWSDPSESGRPGTAGGIMSWNNDRLAAMQRFTGGDTSGAAQARYFLQEDPALIEALQNAGSAQEAISLMNNAWRFAGYDRSGGEAARRAQTAESLVSMFGGDGFTTSTQPAREAGIGGAANEALRAALASTSLPPDVALGLLRGSFDAQRIGDQSIAAAEALRQAELSAEATRAAILDPNNLSGAAIQRDLLTTPGLSFGNQLAAAGQDLSGFAGVISPTVTPDAEVNAALERANAADAVRAGQDPLSRSFALAETFRTSEDVGGTLMGQFELPSDTSLDSTYVNRRVTSLADAAGVTPGEMAAVISELAQGNGGMFQEIINAPADVDLYRSMISLAQNRFSSENRDTYDRTQREREASEAQRAAAQIEYDTARARALKLPVGSPERAVAEREANALRETVLAGRTPREREQNLRDYIAQTGMGSRLERLEPGSTEHTQALMQLIEWIRVDSTLTQTEKELLLADIQG